MVRKVHGTLGSVDRCSCQCTLAVISSFCGSAEAVATKSPVCAILGNPIIWLSLLFVLPCDTVFQVTQCCLAPNICPQSLTM